MSAERGRVERSTSDRRQQLRRASDTGPGPGKLSTRILWLIGIVALLTSVLHVVMDGDEDGAELSLREFRGTWTTNDPRYVDRAIVFAEQELTLGVGGGEQAAYRVSSVRGRQADVHFEYEITYEGPAGANLMHVFMYPDGMLRLRNPPEVRWTRTAD